MLIGLTCPNSAIGQRVDASLLDLARGSSTSSVGDWGGFRASGASRIEKVVEAAGIEPESEVHGIQTFDRQIVRRILPAVLDDPQEKIEKLLSQLCRFFIGRNPAPEFEIVRDKEPIRQVENLSLFLLPLGGFVGLRAGDRDSEYRHENNHDCAHSANRRRLAHLVRDPAKR
jgi:hypothetical protein